MFFIFEQIPIPPPLNLSSVPTGTSFSTQKIGPLCEARATLINTISQIAKNKPAQKEDLDKINSGLKASVDLVK